MSDPFAALRAQFVERCRTDLARLSDGSAGDEARASIVHQLAGSAGAFGFPEVSAAAGVVDEKIRNGIAPEPDELAGLTRALEVLVGGPADTAAG